MTVEQMRERRDVWRARLKEAKKLPRGSKRKRRIEKCRGKVRQLTKKIRRTPRVIVLDVDFVDNQGRLGPVKATIGHYTAGPKDLGLAHCLSLLRSYHAAHKAKGWGGIGYHLCFARRRWKRRPVIVCCRPISWRGTHTAMANTGHVGIVCHGTGGDWASKPQRWCLKWWLRNAHTAAMPASHRLPAPVKTLPVKVHLDFNPTSCPGSFEPFYRSKGATT